MQELISFSITVTMGFFAIMNPIGNAPIYLGLVEGASETERRNIALRSVLYAFFIVTLFVLSGGIIFKIFGITIQAFQIAGGVLVFLVGYHLVHGKMSPIHHMSAEGNNHVMDYQDIAITPLAIPILAGPGTISSALSFTASNSSIINLAIVIAIFAFICVLTYLAFIFSEKLISFLRPEMVKVITRLMGLILTIIAVQMMIRGIKGLIV